MFSLICIHISFLLEMLMWMSLFDNSGEGAADDIFQI